MKSESLKLQTESALKTVETKLDSLVDDLRARLQADASERAEVETTLENFVLKATGIQRMMMQFRNSDLSTRRFVRHHLDEEFEALQEAYRTLSRSFTETM